MQLVLAGAFGFAAFALRQESLAIVVLLVVLSLLMGITFVTSVRYLLDSEKREA